MEPIESSETSAYINTADAGDLLKRKETTRYVVVDLHLYVFFEQSFQSLPEYFELKN